MPRKRGDQPRVSTVEYLSIWLMKSIGDVTPDDFCFITDGDTSTICRISDDGSIRAYVVDAVQANREYACALVWSERVF
jgi:hypothetical protein